MIELRALGPPRLLLDGREPPPELLWRKNFALLVYLARSRDRAATRETLGALLWGEKPESSARHSLNEAVRVLRRGAGEEVLLTEGERLRLAEDAVVLDTDRLERHLAVEAWEPAADLVAGRFLEGFGVPDASRFEDWMAVERELWLRQSILALSGRARQQLTRGDVSGATRTAGRALVLDPLSDAAVRAVMEAAALAGERGVALRTYSDFQDRLREEVGAEPEAETVRLADRIRRERSWQLPEALGEEPATRRAELVGRDRQMERLLGAWRAGARRGRARLLVVEGGTGSGRSRVAEETAARARLEGAVVAAIRVVPVDSREPWSGLAGLLRGGLLEAPGLAVAAPGALAFAATLAPGWSERFGDEIGDAEPWPAGRALAELLRPAAEEQPLLLVVDDADWLDPASASALESALRTLESSPLALLVTLERSAEPPEALERLRAAVGRELGGERVLLEPLGLVEVRDLAARVLPEYGPEALGRVARRVQADSAGVPLLVVELLAAIRMGLELDEREEGGASTLTAWPQPERTLEQTMPAELPDPLVSAIRVSFRRLSSRAQAVLAAAAVLDERVETESLTRATGRPRDDVEAALDELEWHRWLAAEARGYSFVARVVRRIVAREMTTAGQRARIRERAAQASSPST